MPHDDTPAPSRAETLLLAIVGLTIIVLFVAFFMLRAAPLSQQQTTQHTYLGAPVQGQFSPDGARVLTVGGDRAVLWDAATGAQLQEFVHPLEGQWAAAAGGSTVSGGAGGDGGLQARTLVLAHVLGEGHPVHRAMAHMGQLIGERSGGKWTLDLKPNGVLGDEKALTRKCQSGEIQLTKTSASALESFHRPFGTLSLPYLFSDDAHYWRVLEGPIGRELLAGVAGARLRGLCYYDAGARSLYATQPIAGFDDLRGRTIRVQQSDTMIRAMRAFGMVPQDLSWGAELIGALKSGRVVAAENNVPSYYDSSHYESAPYYYMNRHCRPPDVLVASELFWQSLSEAERALLSRAASDSVPFERRLWDELTEDYLTRLAAAGVTITRDVDTEPFRRTVAPLYAALDEPTRALVARIRGE